LALETDWQIPPGPRGEDLASCRERSRLGGHVDADTVDSVVEDLDLVSVHGAPDGELPALELGQDR
jgi:hypothetical protein